MKTALYYPYIHFGDRRWLRTTALYYDKITRIIPEGFEPETVWGYSAMGEGSEALVHDIRALREAGVIDEERPEPHTGTVAERFFDVASALITDPKLRNSIAPQLARRQFYRIHPDKIDATLARILEEHGLARRQSNEYPDWRIEPVIGGIYMLLLAQHMAGNRPLITDTVPYQSLLCASFSTGGREASTLIPQKDNSFRLVAAVCRTAAPNGLEGLPIDRVLRVREQYSEHRDRMQQKISELARSIEAVTDEKTISERVERHVEAISDEVENIKDKLLSQNITLGSIIMALSIPLAAATRGKLSATLASGAIALGAGAARYFVERRITQRSPWMYLVDISGALTPRQLSAQITQLNLKFDGDDPDPFRPDWRGELAA